LEKPQEIEAKGGYVPSGLLLWGPPGTGKTLMAEAVAGETGKPFVFVDPGAFTNMFMGVGILKLKGLLRKLRKLALRYGGVVVFFDEADVLGNRGQTSGGFDNSEVPEQREPAQWLSTQGRREIVNWLQRPSAVETASQSPRRRLRESIIMAGMGGMG